MGNTFKDLKENYLDKITDITFDNVINATVFDEVEIAVNTFGEQSIIQAFAVMKANFDELKEAFTKAKMDFTGFSDSLTFEGQEIPDLLDKALEYSEDAIYSFSEGGHNVYQSF